MSQTLYRKYRPKNFSEVIGQEQIVRILSNAIAHKRIGQAYLFTGPRGTGKTSIARIFAKTVNCASLVSEKRTATKLGICQSEAKADILINPCNKCSNCEIINSGKSLDIIEIDAASNTGVDNIRELRETVSLAPSILKYKVYIIDEVHMLSTGAFNALLKTLEEPPSHVIFILATTEIHKVPETIISRCQRFDFARLPIKNIIEKLNLIAKAEKIKINSEALEMIAIAAEGGMRDAESVLGQIITLEDENITTEEVEGILGATDRKTAGEIAEMITKKDSYSAIAKINDLLENGYDLQVFNKSLINYLRQLMLIKISPDLKKYFAYEMPENQIEKMAALSKEAELSQIISAINLFLEAQNKISSFILPQLPLEIAIIKATKTFPEKIIENINDQHNNSAGKINKKISEHDYDKMSEIEKFDDSSMKKSNSVKSSINILDVKSRWPEFLVAIRPYNHSLSALLSNCRLLKTEKNVITLTTPYEFYGERLKETKNKLTVESVFSKMLGCAVEIRVLVDKNIVLKKESDKEKTENHSSQNSLLSSALEIMGGRIVSDLPEKK
jgi:DNA polymerase-3 subunit gamma/tau